MWTAHREAGARFQYKKTVFLPVWLGFHPMVSLRGVAETGMLLRWIFAKIPGKELVFNFYYVQSMRISTRGAHERVNRPPGRFPGF